MTNKIVICNTKPIKYRDKSPLIVAMDFDMRFSLESGMKEKKVLCKIRLSFIKKKLMNKIENRAILKDPLPPIIELNISGMFLKLESTSTFLNWSNKSIPRSKK